LPDSDVVGLADGDGLFAELADSGLLFFEQAAKVGNKPIAIESINNLATFK